jgi:hypothetical protein
MRCINEHRKIVGPVDKFAMNQDPGARDTQWVKLLGPLSFSLRKSAVSAGR